MGYRWSIVILIALTIAACGPGAQPDESSQVIVPIGGAAEPRPAGAPASEDVTSADANLPGRLLFVKNADLWLWQGDTGRQLTTQGNLSQPAWSPDGTRIVCVQRDASFGDIVLMSATGGDQALLTSNGSTAPPTSYDRIYSSLWAFYPAFSPDGSEIVFASQFGPPFGSPAAEYNLSLYAIPAAVGGNKTQLYASDEGHVGRVAFAPDGTLAFAYTPGGDAAPQIMRYNRESNVAELFPGAPEQSYDPSFSPDGRWLAFATRDGTKTDIFVASTSGGGAIRLTTLGSARAPAFSPDGALLAFLALSPNAAQFDLWVVDLTPEADGLRVGEPRQVTKGMGIDADSGLAWAE
jgi:TolB protein